MRNLCDQLDLSQSVLDASTKLYKDFYWKTKDRLKNARGEVLVSSCIFGATRLLELSFPAKSFCNVVKMKMGTLFKTLRVMQRELDVNFAPAISKEEPP